MKLLIIAFATLLLLLTRISGAADWPNTAPDCLAANIYHEARGESLIGQYFIGFVTLNRVKSPKFPDSICGVVKQHKQFSWYVKGKNKYPKDHDAWKRACSVAAKFILENPVVQLDFTEGALYYHADYVKPKWRKEKIFIGTVGDHLFYR